MLMTSSNFVSCSGQIGRLGAFEDLVHEAGRLAAELLVGRGVAGQSALLHHERVVEHRREPLLEAGVERG